MLALTRKWDQTIVIGDDIVIRVIRLDGHQVRLGITAPRDVRVDRGEVRQRMFEEGLGVAFPPEAYAYPERPPVESIPPVAATVAESRSPGPLVDRVHPRGPVAFGEHRIVTRRNES